MVSQGYMLLLLLLLLVASVGETYGVQLPGYCICYVRNIFTSGWGIEPHIALQQRPLDVLFYRQKIGSQGYMLLLLLLLLVASVGEYHGARLPSYWLFNTANIFAGGWGIEPHTALLKRPPDVCL